MRVVAPPGTMGNDRTGRGRIEAPTRRRVLRGTAAGAAAVAGLPALSGVAAAHFPLRLDVDVQPENETNFVDLDEHESVAVAVRPVEFLDGDGERTTFDPTARPVRYRFGSRFALEDGDGARPLGDGEAVEAETDDGDGGEALVLEFPVAETGFDGGEETAWLYWEEDESGEHGYAGVDAVRIYGTGSESESAKADGDLAGLLRRLARVLETSG